MTLLQKLYETPKWKDFEQWYYSEIAKTNYINLDESWETENYEECYSYHIGFLQLPFVFQKGIFEKFIESQGGKFEQTWTGQALGNHTFTIYDSEENYCSTYNFEEALIWYFNN